MSSFVFHDEGAGVWRVFTQAAKVVQAWTLDELGAVFAAIEDARTTGCWAAGFLTYEAGAYFDRAFPVRRPPDGLPYAHFSIFPDSRTLPSRAQAGLSRQELVSVLLSPAHESMADPLSAAPGPGDSLSGSRCNAAGPSVGQASGPERASLSGWTPEISRACYNAAIEEIRSRIASGETYQVNYTFRQRARFAGDPASFFIDLAAGQGAGLAAYLDLGRFVICSASPELFFRRQGDMVVCRPMKGTAPRGLYSHADHQRQAWLATSAKNRAENLMIVDMVRNDLGRICRAGTVRVDQLFGIEKYASVWQMTSTVSARCDGSLQDILSGLFPSASITGAPKIQTMTIIDRLERSPRGVYTGSIGFVAPNGDCQFNVAIRTVVVDRERGLAEYGVGGGVVWDSTAAEEYQECLAKCAILSRPVPEFSLLDALLWTPDDGFHYLDLHLRRLADSAEYFGFPYKEDCVIKALEAAVRAVAGPRHRTAGIPQEPLKVRLVLPANGSIEAQGARMSDVPLPRAPRVVLARQPVDAGNVFLYHKTTCRDVYTRARAASPGADDVILWNVNGELTESCMCNVVLEMDGVKYTPPVACGLLAGTYRAHLLARGELTERILSREDYDRADAVYLINSVRGLRRARRQKDAEPQAN